MPRPSLAWPRHSAEAKADELKWPAVLLFSALLFAQAAVTVAAITVALALATRDRAAARRACRRPAHCGIAYVLFALAMAKLKTLK